MKKAPDLFGVFLAALMLLLIASCHKDSTTTHRLSPDGYFTKTDFPVLHAGDGWRYLTTIDSSHHSYDTVLLNVAYVRPGTDTQRYICYLYVRGAFVDSADIETHDSVVTFSYYHISDYYVLGSYRLQLPFHNNSTWDYRSSSDHIYTEYYPGLSLLGHMYDGFIAFRTLSSDDHGEQLYFARGVGLIGSETTYSYYTGTFPGYDNHYTYLLDYHIQ